MLCYPATLEADGTGFCVSFRDIPEALTGAETLEEARVMAVDALRTALDFYFEDQRLVPAPSEPFPNEELIALPASVASKVLLLNEVVSQHVTPSELARRMGTTRQEMNRILDLNHATKIDTIELAIKCLGKALNISVV